LAAVIVVQTVSKETGSDLPGVTAVVLRLVVAGDLSFPEVADVVADAGKRRVVDRSVAAWGGQVLSPLDNRDGDALEVEPSGALRGIAR